MDKEQVTFGVDQHRINTIFDRSRLKLGSKVFVEYSSSGVPIEVALEDAGGSIPHWVQWISTSEWYVELAREFRCRQEFIQRVEAQIGDFISSEEVCATLKVLEESVRPDHCYKTSELEKNPLSVVFTVLERLDVISRLGRQSAAIELHGYKEPLVVYLLLTCFDRLGQPADWLDFGAWLKSKKQNHKREREKALQSAGRVTDLITGSLQIHCEYVALYGVKSSFMRFIREVLPHSARRALLDSIEITKCSCPPAQHIATGATDAEKERYLLMRRNDYTHKAAFTPPAGEWLARSSSNHVQAISEEFWTDTVTHGWPAVLEETVRKGLAAYLRQELQRRSNPDMGQI